jgi:hypothetical protein
MGGKSDDFNPVIGMKSYLEETSQKTKNRGGK